MVRALAICIVLATHLATGVGAAATDGSLWVHVVDEAGLALPDACVEAFVDTGGGTPGASQAALCDQDDAARDGTIALNLPAGAYVLVQVTAPAGYDLPASGTPATVEAGKARHVELVNTPAGGSSVPPTPTAAPASPASGDFRGRVDIGGRSLFLACEGSGAPTVILEAGGPGLASASWSEVQHEIAKITRTCSYDRAFLGDSDDAPGGTRTIEDSVNDLRALITAAGIACPCVFAGASWGGAIVRLYADRFRDDVGGLVSVDAVPPRFVDRFLEIVPGDSPARERLLGVDQLERVDLLASLRLADAADLPTGVPAMVLTHGRGSAFQADLPVDELEAAWQEAQAAYAVALNAQLIEAGNSSGDLLREQPDVVVTSISYVVSVVIAPTTSPGTIRVRTVTEDGSALHDACYEIYLDASGDQEDEYDGMACDDEDGALDGTVVFRPAPGTYVLRQVKPPAGYVLAGERTVAIDAGAVVDVEVVNRPAPA
jgi:pimeloyl-ACP methyl ester carboxylesterase